MFIVILFHAKGNMTSIPTDKIDANVDVIEIVGPKNDLIIGPIFTKFKNLEVLRIIDSNIPAIGTHSLWGLKSLRILGLYFFFIISSN